MANFVKIVTSRGDSDMVGMFQGLAKLSVPNSSDLLFAGQRQRSRILQRTEKGLDVQGTPFVPYSVNGPVYFYPKGAKGQSLKQRSAAISRLATKGGAKRLSTGKSVAVRGSGGLVRASGKINVQRTKLGLKFKNYAEMKAFFGRINVDLRGIQAPHMLQAIVVRIGGVTVAGLDFDTLTGVANAFGFSSEADAGRFVGNDAPAREVSIGIYGGEEADRAAGHNEGEPRTHLPQRRFLGANDSDSKLFLDDIVVRVTARVKSFMEGKRK